MKHVLLVAAGGALGASGRYLLGRGTYHLMGPGFPYGTFCANVLGGFAMGILVSYMALRVSGGEGMRLFLGVGLLGGFTTFSAFSLETMRMIETKAYSAAMTYVGLSVIFAIGACALGLIIGRKVFAL